MRLRAAVAGCIGLALLAGCSAQAEPEVTVTSPVAPVPSTATGAAESTTATSIPTAAASATGAPIPVPTPPAEMARDDEVGAVAAAVYFMTELYTYTVNAADTEPWLAMSGPDCSFCSNIADSVTRMHSAGEWAEVAPMVANSPRFEESEPGHYTVAFAFTTGTDLVFSPDGTVKSSTAPVSAQAAFRVLREGDGWVIDGGNADPDQETP